jgi:hypothetical protein
MAGLSRQTASDWTVEIDRVLNHLKDIKCLLQPKVLSWSNGIEIYNISIILYMGDVVSRVVSIAKVTSTCRSGYLQIYDRPKI